MTRNISIDTLPKGVDMDDILAAAEESMFGMSDTGFCLDCGATLTCEPDARDYPCECCGANAVYGAEELLVMLVP